MQHVHAWLVLSGLGAVASSYLLDRDQHVIGRSPGCDIRLLHRSVSFHHVILTVEQPELIMHDLGSTARPSVNENRVSDAEIAIGTPLHFGRWLRSMGQTTGAFLEQEVFFEFRTVSSSFLRAT
jgi:hypothetical protein